MGGVMQQTVDVSAELLLATEVLGDVPVWVRHVETGKIWKCVVVEMHDTEGSRRVEIAISDKDEEESIQDA